MIDCKGYFCISAISYLQDAAKPRQKESEKHGKVNFTRASCIGNPFVFHKVKL